MNEARHAAADIIANGKWDEQFIGQRIEKAVRDEIRTLSREMTRWTRRSDDARRIPDVLMERADEYGAK